MWSATLMYSLETCGTVRSIPMLPEIAVHCFSLRCTFGGLEKYLFNKKKVVRETHAMKRNVFC